MNATKTCTTIACAVVVCACACQPDSVPASHDQPKEESASQQRNDVIRQLMRDNPRRVVWICIMNESLHSSLRTTDESAVSVALWQAYHQRMALGAGCTHDKICVEDGRGVRYEVVLDERAIVLVGVGFDGVLNSQDDEFGLLTETWSAANWLFRSNLTERM